MQEVASILPGAWNIASFSWGADVGTQGVTGLFLIKRVLVVNCREKKTYQVRTCYVSHHFLYFDTSLRYVSDERDRHCK